MKRLTATGFLFIAFSLVACGDDAESDGGSATDDLGSKQLQDLTPEQEKAICEEESAKIVFSKEDLCELQGLFASLAGAGSCEELKTQCLSMPVQEQPPKDCSTPDERFDGCTATVDELKACMHAQIDAMTALTCATNPADLAKTDPACETVYKKCPQLSDNS